MVGLKLILRHLLFLTIPDHPLVMTGHITEYGPIPYLTSFIRIFGSIIIVAPFGGAVINLNIFLYENMHSRPINAPI